MRAMQVGKILSATCPSLGSFVESPFGVFPHMILNSCLPQCSAFGCFRKFQRRKLRKARRTVVAQVPPYCHRYGEAARSEFLVYCRFLWIKVGGIEICGPLESKMRP